MSSSTGWADARRRGGACLGILVLFGLLVLLLYLLPARRHRTGSYAPSVLVALLFAALLTLLIVGVLPWDLGTGFNFF